VFFIVNPHSLLINVGLQILVVVRLGGGGDAQRRNPDQTRGNQSQRPMVATLAKGSLVNTV